MNLDGLRPGWTGWQARVDGHCRGSGWAGGKRVKVSLAAKAASGVTKNAKKRYMYNITTVAL